MCGHGLLAVPLTLVFAGVGFGQSEPSSASINIGNQVISLGMPVQKAIKSLQQDFTVVHCDPASACIWMVLNRTGRKEIVGMIDAKNNRIVKISHKVFERERNSAQDVFAALFQAASGRSPVSRSSCSVSSQTEYGPPRGPSGFLAEIQLSCGDSKFKLHSSTFDEGAKSHTRYEAWEELGGA